MTWYAAQVEPDKEYDTMRELIGDSFLDEGSIFIPRKQVYNTKGEELEKKTEMMLPGYILLNLGMKPVLNGIENLNNYLNILGPVTNDEMENLRIHDNNLGIADAHNGDKIIVIRGPFVGVEGYIKEELDSGKFKCKLVFHGNDLITELDGGIIEKVT